MEELLEIARLKGWRAAVEGRLKEIDPEAYSYARDETRANWRRLLPAGKGTERVLYAGRDFGSVAAQLAACYGTVVHLADTEEEARFLLLRACEKPQQKFFVLPGSIFRPPFGEASFDIAVIDGIEDLSAHRARYQSVQKNLLQALGQLLGCIKPQGLLIVNSGRKLTARAAISRTVRAVAEWAAALFSKLRGMIGHQAEQWPAGMADFLAGSGFDILASYRAIPHFKDNLYLLPADSPFALKYFLRVICPARAYLASKKIRLALKVVNFFLSLNLARLILHLIPNSVVLAQKRSKDVTRA